MTLVLQYEPRVKVDYTQLWLGDYYSGTLMTAVGASPALYVEPAIANPVYDTTRPADPLYGRAVVTPYLQAYTSILGSGWDISLWQTRFTVGYLETGPVYDLANFWMTALTFTQFVYRPAQFSAALFAGDDTAILQGTGSTFDGGPGSNQIVYSAPIASYTLTIPFARSDRPAYATFGPRGAAVLAQGWATPDTLRNITRLSFADVTLAFDPNGIDLPGTGATGTTYATPGSDCVVRVPWGAQGVAFQVDPNIFSDGNATFVLMPDGGGGTRITRAAIPDPQDYVAAADGAGGLAYYRPAAAAGLTPTAEVQALLDGVNAGILAGTVTRAVNPTGGIPAQLVAGTGELIASAAGAYAMPSGYRTALMSGGATTLSGGMADGQLVIADDGFAFNAGAGSGSVFGGGGTAYVSQYPGAGAQVIDLGIGDDTVVALGGAATISAGAGHNTVLLGDGAYRITSTGDGLGRSTLFGTATGDVLTAGAAAGDFLVAGAGAETLTAQGSTGVNQIYAGAGNDIIATGDVATLVMAGTGAATISGGPGTDLIAFPCGRHPTVELDNFHIGQDLIALQGFPDTELITAFTGASISAGSEHITLSDGTSITLHGIAFIGSGSFIEIPGA